MRKKCFHALLAFLLIAIIPACKKDDPSPTNSTINITNAGNNTFNGTDHQFTSLELTPTESGSTAKTYEFISSLNTTISIGVDLPKTGSYKIKVYANNSAGYLQWNSIAMSIGGTTVIHLYCPGNMSYKDGSTAAGITPDLSSGL